MAEMVTLTNAEVHPGGKAIFVKATLTEEHTDLSRDRRLYFPISMADEVEGEWSVPEWLAKAKAAEQVYLWASSDGTKGIDHLHGACFTAYFAGRDFMVTQEAMECAKDYRENGSRPKPEAVSIDLGEIRKMIDVALSNRVARPRFRAEGLDITKAGDNSANPGHLYVKTINGDYQGKITPEGEFLAIRDCESSTVEKLQNIATDPLGSAIAFGKEFGKCSCCGRTLTNPESIELGIGPICRSNYGLEYSESV